MTTKNLLFGLLAILLSDCSAKNLVTSKPRLEVFNRRLEQVQENGRLVFRLSEQNGQGGVWFKNMEFSEGSIEFDVKGRDMPQKSFVGIAFHGVDSVTYETVYFRPFNFLATDPARHVHAVQYSFEPRFGFQQLRDTRKDEFESAIKPAGLPPAEWFHVRVEVRGNNIKAFVNGNKEPTLDVNTLNPDPAGKMIGFWVGNGSNGDFANLNISKY